MTETTYNGWSNYETWAVSLWIDNDRGSYEYWREQAAEQQRVAPTCQQVTDGIWTAEDAARFLLADQLKEHISEESPLHEPSLYSDLLGAALSEVNWCEIVEHWLADLPEDGEPNAEDPADSFWGPPMSVYTRAQAIKDGVLVNVSKMAREAGIKYPTALTAAVWGKYVVVPEGVEGQDENGRLWDILLTMFRIAAKQSAGGSQILFQVLVQNDNTSPKLVTLKAICGPGDTPDPVLTIMLPDED